MNVQYKAVIMGLVMAALVTGVTVSSVGTAFAGGDHDGKHKNKNNDGVKRILEQENKCSKGADCKNYGTIQDHIIIDVDGKDKKNGGPHEDAFALSVPQQQTQAPQ
jgi:hypothetical protein